MNSWLMVMKILCGEIPFKDILISVKVIF